MLKQYILSSFLGICCVIAIAQNDPWMQHLVLDYVRTESQKVLDCHISCKGSHVSFVNGAIAVRDVFVMPKNGEKRWYWSAKNFTMCFSWWQLLLYGTLDFSSALRKLVLYSKVQDAVPAIAPHLQLLFLGPQLDVYTFLKDMSIEEAHIKLEDHQNQADIEVQFDMQAKQIDNCMKATIDLYDGFLCHKNRALCNALSGSFQMDAFDGKPYIDMCMRGAASVCVPQLGNANTPCNISCSWQHNRGVLSLKNLDHSFAIDPVIIQKDGQCTRATVSAKVPLAYVWCMLCDEQENMHISGDCDVNIEAVIVEGAPLAKGHICAKRIAFDNTEIGSLAKMTFQATPEQCKGKLYLQRTSGACGAGLWHWDLATKSGSVELKNTSRLTFSPKHDWRILPEDVHVSLALSPDGQATVMYTAQATHTKTEDTIASQGVVSIDDTQVEAQGQFDGHDYALQATRAPRFVLHELRYGADDDPLIAVSARDAYIYDTSIQIGCIKEFIKKHWQRELQGEGTLQAHIEKKDHIYQANVQLQDGAIRLPRTYNFVSGLRATAYIDPEVKLCTVRDFHCDLHNGVLSSERMHLAFADDFTPRFVFAPLVLEQCLLNVGKQLFAIVSADFLLQKNDRIGTMLSGNIFLDRAQLKENIFSQVFQKNMRLHTAYSLEGSHDQLQCDLHIKTKYPVRVQTPFLKTDARIDLHMQNNMRQPHITGDIRLSTGQLHFPYRPLYIAKGALHFMPGKIDDPIIELVAKNTIKKHNIMLQASGSLQDPHVTLEASPTLSEEQIISLLLVGSQEESLNMVMPALLVQNVSSLLFGYDQSMQNMNSYFGKFLKPFRRIHLVPSFIDQSGRGGLRGAIEIDISDRWRAIIQKNFSLTEDTRFELEYLFSDDISVRGVRDIRRDLIGEVETRWKFGDG